MRWLTQVVAVSLFNLRNLPARLGPALATVFGVTGVVLVFVGVLSIGVGFERTMTSTGDPENVLVLRGGANDEMSSGLTLEMTKLVADTSGVARGEAGPLASAELYVIVDLPKRGLKTPANVPLRGVSPAAFEVRRELRIVDGRNFETGKNEIIVGAAALAQFEGLELGAEQRWGENVWKVVGIFSTGGTVEDSEIWADAIVVQQAYNRGSTFQSIHLRLEEASYFERFAEALTSDPRLAVSAKRETEYWTAQSTGLTGLVRILGGVIGALMGCGAVFAALNTMYTAVSARTREIATLRALGFGAAPVVISVLVEAVFLAAVGGALGALLSHQLFNGVQTSTINWQTFSQVAFAFEVTPALMAGGFVYALVMGFVGGFFPAVRAARLPVAMALREP